MKHLPHCVLGLAFVLTLSACGTNRSKSQRAPIDVPPQYGLGYTTPEAPSVPLDVESVRAQAPVSGTAWWQAFGDRRLDSLIEQVVSHNSNLAAAGLALRRARLTAGLAFDARLPQAGGYLDSSEQTALSGPSRTSRAHAAAFEVSYMADLWGRLSAQHAQATWQAQATEEDLEATRIALIGETARLYWTLAYTNQSITLGEQSLASLERILDLVGAQFDLGEVSRLEVREAEQRLEAQRAAQSELEQQRAEVRSALMVLLDGSPWPGNSEPSGLSEARMLDIEAGLCHRRSKTDPPPAK